MAILSGFSLTEKPIGCPEIILKSQILFFRDRRQRSYNESA